MIPLSNITALVLYPKRMSPSELGRPQSGKSYAASYGPMVRGGRGRRVFAQVDFSLRGGRAPYLAACAFPPPCLPARPRPIPLQRPAPLHILSIARIRPRRPRLHIPAQRCARARVFAGFRCFAHVRPLLPAPGPTIQPFNRAHPSAPVPFAYSRSSAVPEHAFSRFSAASLGRAFAHSSASGPGTAESRVWA